MAQLGQGSSGPRPLRAPADAPGHLSVSGVQWVPWRPLPSPDSGCSEGRRPTAHANVPTPASSAPCGPPVPSPPPGPLLSGEPVAGNPTRQFICSTLAGLPRASEKRFPASGAGDTSERISHLHFMRSPLARPLMSLLSGHTSPDTFLPGTPPPRPAYPVPPRSYRACLCSLYWGAPDSGGGGCMGYGGSAEGGTLPGQHGHLGHSPELGY